MATARLRRTFQYPTDMDSEDDGPEAMDEEEQENLIHTISTQNATRNEQYTTLLLILTLISTLPYIRTLFTPRTTLLSLLSLTSLFSTAYILRSFPPGTTGIAFLDSLNNTSSAQTQIRSLAAKKAALLQASDGGPVRMYLPYLNVGLCVVLFGLGGVVARRGGEGVLWWGFEGLPGVVYVVVVLAKWIIGGVDPEGELGGLRYGLKGA
ncbi:hypothetical protein DL95DRAFT_323978 [Leptodontidium sp. 2 PMI_412]|nr:hypothetical protein DL95DRAFT_323978 [Leptodontidium sp. 2 PMI_412]